MDDYTPGQVEAVLHEIGVDVVAETDTNLLCHCPFHKNNDTPAFSIDIDKGVYLCFNSACDERGNLLKLVQKLTDSNPFVAKRLIEKHRGSAKPLGECIEDLFERKDELPTFSKDILNRMYDDLWGSPGYDYMLGRGFTDQTLSTFAIGYSHKRQMVSIPVHDWDGNPVGIVARSIEGKRFKNSDNLPTRKVLFNTHRAKRHGETVIIVESSMDAMRIHQAGFPNVVATNGSIFSSDHVQLINRYWNELVIMTDFENPEDHRSPMCKKCENVCTGHRPGRALGNKMIKALPGKRIRWGCYDYGIVFPHDAKDAGDMTEEEIRQCIDNSLSMAEYEWMLRDFESLSIV